MLANNHPEVTLYIAGDGSEADFERLNLLIQQHRFQQQVTLLGQITNSMEWMQACDIFLQPSREEGFGLVFVEAGLCGKPTITTHVGGIPDIINNETGYLVEPQQPAKIAKCISVLLNDPDKAMHLGDAAKRRINQHFVHSK